jgi:hypothetical protein
VPTPTPASAATVAIGTAVPSRRTAAAAATSTRSLLSAASRRNSRRRTPLFDCGSVTTSMMAPPEAPSGSLTGVIDSPPNGRYRPFWWAPDARARSAERSHDENGIRGVLVTGAPARIGTALVDRFVATKDTILVADLHEAAVESSRVQWPPNAQVVTVAPDVWSEEESARTPRRCVCRSVRAPERRPP